MKKKLIALLSAAILAVTTFSFTVCAAEDRILSVGMPCGYNYAVENADNMTAGHLGAARLVKESWTGDTYSAPGFILDGQYNSLHDYSTLEVEYTCTNPSEIKYLSVAVQGGTAEWYEIQEQANEKGKIIFDLSPKRGKTYESLQFWAHPLDSYKLGDVFDPGITIESAKLIAADTPFVPGIGPTVLEPNEWSGDTYGLPEYSIMETWTKPKPLSKYSELVLEYTCSNVSEIEKLRLVVHGGNCGWNQVEVDPSDSGQIVLDLTEIQDKTFEAAFLYVQPIDSYNIGDTIDPGIAVTREEFIADPDFGYSMKFTDRPVNMTVYESIGESGDMNAYSDYFLTDVNCGLKWNETRDDVFKLTDIVYNNDSTGGSAEDFEILPSIKFQNGEKEKVNIISNMTVTVTQRLEISEVEWKLNDIVQDDMLLTTFGTNNTDNITVTGIGYMIRYIGDFSNLNTGDVLTLNPSGSEIVDDEHNVSITPIDGELDPDLTLDVSENNADDIEMKPEDKATVGKILFAYDIKLMKGIEEVQPNCSIKVVIPVPEGIDGTLLKVYHAEEDGSFTDMNAVYDPQTNTISFVTNHFSLYVLANSGEEVILGDVNGDGKLSPRDITILGKAYVEGTANKYVAIADMNSDGSITPRDITALGKLYMNL